MPPVYPRLLSVCLALSSALVLTNTLSAFSKSGSTFSTDGSLSDVSSAVAAAGAGETVQVPAGTFTWGTSGAFVSVTKAITLTGAGRDATIINLATTGGTYGNATVRVSAAAIVKSMTFNQPNTGGPTAFAANNSDGWRFTDIKFIGGTGGAWMMYVENAYGLIDSCDITGNAGNAELIFVRSKPDSWTTDNSMGTVNAVFIEDCTFRGQGYVCDFNSYGRGVVRGCTITGSFKVDGHGKYSNTPPRGVRQMEVYNNTWTLNAGFFPAIEMRGGTGMVFGNTTTVSTTAWLLLNEYYVSTGAFSAANYPIDDQIGVGRDPKVGGSEPMYLWSNRRSGSSTTPWPIESYADITGVINADRDYFNEVSPFKGASGMGTGPKSQMLALSPSKKGVGFWVTDEGNWNKASGANGQLYVWNGSSWSLKYVPYNYPHTLRSSVASAPTPPRILKFEILVADPK